MRRTSVELRPAKLSPLQRGVERMLCCGQVLAPLAATLLALASGATASPAPRSLLVFRGNVVLTDEVYLYLLDLPANSKATEALADEVEGRIARFLRLCDYHLATVSATVKDAQIIVDIDDGPADRIVFLGEI